MIRIEYDGALYCGWQTQLNGRSIQGEISRALTTVLREPIKISGAGRTDAGVHALGQVADFKSQTAFDPERLRWQLNAILPNDIVVHLVQEVDRDFSARRSAVSRTYDYRILNRPYPSALWGRYSWWVSKPLDIERMAKSAGSLIGAHDFSAFAAKKEANGANLSTWREVRGLKIAELAEAEGLISVEITANAFLHHMVRLIVGTLVKIGSGKSELAIEDILISKDIRLAGPRAPAKGLRLVRVDYTS